MRGKCAWCSRLSARLTARAVRIQSALDACNGEVAKLKQTYQRVIESIANVEGNLAKVQHEIDATGIVGTRRNELLTQAERHARKVNTRALPCRPLISGATQALKPVVEKRDHITSLLARIADAVEKGHSLLASSEGSGCAASSGLDSLVLLSSSISCAARRCGGNARRNRERV